MSVFLSIEEEASEKKKGVKKDAFNTVWWSHRESNPGPKKIL